ncbi:hypothetical protein [Sphingomonas morindae]|uniref:Uncharacterized protein n=1 Tax=Sphingomonas morindae TaxID=1541170 RepID=A0ABY4X8N8_9SPHN|nr:hypothetical protein [Sphingomonas morindae]USI73319.1 hypothetical protein LHA26_02225 [Sphingomonas morindae]
MAQIDGQWDCEVDSPMGKQQSLLTLTASGTGFAGVASGPLGSVEITNGQVLGDQLSFKMAITLPMPMTLDCEARLIGDDRIEGTVDTGAFGRFPLRATRRG